MRTATDCVSETFYSSEYLTTDHRPFNPKYKSFLSINEYERIQNVPGGKVNILGGRSISHSKQNVYTYMCPIKNGFGDRAISLYSSKIIDKKETIRTVSNLLTYLIRSSYTLRCRGFIFFILIILQTVGILGRVISSSQGL
jgi:hypothetical protein